VIRQASESGHLYGSVTGRDVAEAAQTAGQPIEKTQVQIDTPIKTLGLYPVKVKLHPEVAIKVTVNIARSQEEAKVQDEKGAAVIKAAAKAEADAAVLATEFRRNNRRLPRKKPLSRQSPPRRQRLLATKQKPPLQGQEGSRQEERRRLIHLRWRTRLKKSSIRCKAKALTQERLPFSAALPDAISGRGARVIAPQRPAASAIPTLLGRTEPQAANMPQRTNSLTRSKLNGLPRTKSGGGPYRRRTAPPNRRAAD